MSKFGWSYPPGAANDPYAPYNQADGALDLQRTIAFQKNRCRVRVDSLHIGVMGGIAKQCKNSLLHRGVICVRSFHVDLA